MKARNFVRRTGLLTLFCSKNALNTHVAVQGGDYTRTHRTYVLHHVIAPRYAADLLPCEVLRVGQGVYLQILPRLQGGRVGLGSIEMRERGEKSVVLLCQAHEVK